MSEPSLRDIEKALSTLWMNRDVRNWYLSGAKRDQMPNEGKSLSRSVLDTLDKRGVELYGSLLSFGHHDVMLSVFPYCAQILEKKWDEIVDDYLKCFPPEHYNFNRLCSRFPEYMAIKKDSFGKKGQLLSELSDFEWLELEKIEQDIKITSLPYESLKDPSQFVEWAPVLNPSIMVRKYNYPLFEIIERLQEKGKLPAKLPVETTYIAFYRHPLRNTCCYFQLDRLALLLVEKCQADKLSYQDLLIAYISARNDILPTQAAEEFLYAIDELQESQVYIGSLSCKSS
jgi:hypothetical protein